MRAVRRSPPFAVAALLALGAVRAQDATWFVRGGGGDVRIVGATTRVVRGLAEPFARPAGEEVVRFSPDALGRPLPLPLVVPDGAWVTVAVDGAGPAVATAFAPNDPAWRAVDVPGPNGSEPLHARLVGDEAATAARAVLRILPAAGTREVGVVARWAGPEQHYRIVWDVARGELRLERQLGPAALVLARAPGPQDRSTEHELALQVDGFRIEAFVDDAPVLQQLDGALSHGASGTCCRGDAPAGASFSLASPARPRGSSAVLRGPGSAAFVAAAAVGAGHGYVLQLRLDRPFALVPRDEEGLEPALLMRPAEPVVLLGDLRGSLGPGAIGEIGRDGLVHAEVHWPERPGVRLQAVLVEALLVAPSGEALVGRTPAAPLWP